MYVRGGGPDENLILLDGIQMYGNGHLLGLFSAFPNDAVDEITLHKGSFAARYGGRVSGILDIRSNDGDLYEYHGNIGTGIINDHFHLEGPLIKDKASFSITGRGMHTLLMEGLLQAFKVPANYYFYDLDAKATIRPDSRNRLSFNCFQGKDHLRYQEEQGSSDITWGNALGSIAWDCQWNGNLYSRMTAAFTGYTMDFGYKPKEAARTSNGSGIKDLTAKADFIFSDGKGNPLRFGAEAIRHSFIPDDGEQHKNRHVRGWEFSTYVERLTNLGGCLDLETGLRLSAFISPKGRFFKPEPRISVSVDPGNRFGAKVSYSRMVQYLHLLSPSITTLPVDIWVPVSKGVGPVISDQYSIGTGFGWKGGWEVSLEGYLKRMKGVIEYKDGIMFIDDFTIWENDVSSGIGRAAGVEFLLRKKAGRTTGWLGYTLSKSERRFPDGSIGQGKWFPARYDRRHDISMVLNHRTGRRWDLGAVWAYSTGGTLTVPDAAGEMTLRNNYRLPPSHRLDLSASRHKKKRHGEGILNLGIYNAYNRKNPNLVFHVSGDEEDGPGYLKKVSILPIIPSAGYTRVF